MAKDKPRKAMSMNDLLNEHREADPVAKQISREESAIREEFYTEEVYNDILNYNSQIETLDDLYKGVIPIDRVMVRVFLHVPKKSESGLIEPYTKVVNIKTNNGYGDWATVDSPYPYSTKAVVVAVPKGYETLKVGQIVQLGVDQVQATVSGTGSDAMLSINNAYLHPDSEMDIPTKDPKNQHYGYLLIPTFEIKAIIKDV